MNLSNKKEILIMELKSAGILNEKKIIDAIRKIPREKFVPKESVVFAYEDIPLDIGFGQTISAPHMVAMMSELIEPKKNDVVLEIGTGSGYQAAVLSVLVKKVYSIELKAELAAKARRTLKDISIGNIEVLLGDGSKEIPDMEFDKIIVTCGSDKIYRKWIEKLKIGGILVVPVGPQNRQKLIVAKKTENGISKKKISDVIFVPLRH